MDSNLFKKILDNINMPIGIFDSNGNILYSTKPLNNVSTLDEAKKAFENKYNIQTIDNYTIFIVNENNNQAHQDFISTVSHELRTPLTSIRGFADTMLMAKDKLSKEQTDKFLNIIRNQADRLTRLVENLLEVSNISRTDRLVFKEINFKKFISPIITIFEKKYPKHNFKNVIQDNLPDLWADSDKLEQIMTNLIDNAAKYSSENSDVTIEANFINNNIEIKVINEGEKIPENQLSNIFNKFSRIDNPLTRKTEGSGLGLYITKTLTKQLNGSIVAQNYDNGNIFILTMPASCAERKFNVSGENYER